MKKHLVSAALLTTLCSGYTYADTSNAKAEDKDDQDTLKTGTKIGLFYSQTTNTSISFNSSLWLTYKPNEWEHEAKFNTYYTDSTDEDDGTNKYSLYYKASYDLGKAIAGYVENEYEHNQYETYRQSYTLTTGLAYKIIDEKKTKLEFGLGPGYRYTKRQGNDEDYPNKETNEVIASSYLKGEKTLSKTFSIGGGGKVEYGDSNTQYTADAFIKNTLMTNLAMVVDTQYIYNTDVASTKSNDELYSTLSLSYDF